MGSFNLGAGPSGPDGRWLPGDNQIVAHSGQIPGIIASLSRSERKQYSIAKAILGLSGDRGVDCSLEREVSAAIATKLSRESAGLYIPPRLNPQMTGLDTKTDAAGKYTVATEVRDLIELLRNRTKVIQIGATVLSGLTGNVLFPRQLTGTTGSWISENPGSDVAQVDATFGSLVLSPKTYMATTSYSRQFLAQSSLDAEVFVRTDLAAYHSQAIDAATIAGTGTNNQPLGILKTTGIGDVAMGASGAKITYAKVTELETNVATASADEAGMKYLTTPKIRGVLRCTAALDATVSSVPAWTSRPGAAPGIGDLNGYEAFVSNQVPSTLVKGGSGANCHAVIFGYWPTVLVGEFGVLEIIVDPYSAKKQGMIECTSFQMVDIGVRQPASMAAIQDALLT
jgi:HK97 family phage major capsid protein